MIGNSSQLMQRDVKVKDVFADFAPVWLMNDEYRASKDSFFFNLVYCHPVHSWINQHIRYDLFNNVLYHMGEKAVSDQTMLEVQEHDPYIAGDGGATTPNHPANQPQP
jgi:hypothetical protein